MSEANKQLLRRYFELVDARDESDIFAMIDESFAADYVAHFAASTLEGRDGLKGHVRNALATFGELEHIIEDDFAAGDMVATRTRVRGRLRGEFLGVAPTGQEFECPIIYLHRFERDKIQEAWLDWDSLLTVAISLGAELPRESE